MLATYFFLPLELIHGLEMYSLLSQVWVWESVKQMSSD